LGVGADPTSPDTVVIITMPHKRNPEGSEHLDTLARLARASSGVLVEGVVAGHERDGRAWKAEWLALPELCLLTGAALQLGRRLAAGLEVDTAAMQTNLTRHGDQLASEQILAGLSARVGKHEAQRLMHEVLAPGVRDVHDVRDALVAAGAVTEADREPWPGRWVLGDAPAMVDTVVARARRARADEPESWS
jgi:adenylosuccinate lyase